MDEPRSSLFAGTVAETPSALADAIAGSAARGHFDELRGGTASDGALVAEWARFFDLLGESGLDDLDRRMANLRRQIRDNGVTYNVYADEGSAPPRPWSVDLFPLILDPATWQRICAGVLQRVHVLDRVMADMYGEQRLLASGLLPPALVHGHPGFLREMQGAQPKGTLLHIAAFDLARGPDGHWWVVSQRTQAPSGLGYLLENRLAISRQFPEAFESMQVQRLASTYGALVESLKRSSPAGKDALIALLTPGPYNETYFEHAYLARYLGLTLVEGSDLTVRDDRLYLKTLQGLKPVHGLLKRVDDEFLDPLELRADSTLGVPGLLQAVRAGNVLLANAPGSAFLESPALLGFLPALARHLLGEELTLPALPTWWCGEDAARENAVPRMADCVIKPTYPPSPWHDSFEAVLGSELAQRGRDEWSGRIQRRSIEHTLQEQLPLSQIPTWQQNPAAGGGHIAPRSVLLRVFAVSDGPGSWRVLPGGMARVVGDASGVGSAHVSMQRGGSSADVWVLAPGEVDTATLLPTHAMPEIITRRTRLVTSRAAEHLFWLGRYTERAENNVRLARLVLQSLNGDDQSSQPLLAWLSATAVDNGLVSSKVPSAAQARRVFERSLIRTLASDEGFSVGQNLRSQRLAAAGVRERLAQEHWSTIVHAEEDFYRRFAAYEGEDSYLSVDALRILESASSHLAAITGGQTDRMTRDDGWRLLSIGRHIERLGFLASALQLALETGAVFDEAGFEGVLALFDSTITFHAQYQQTREVAALVDLLVIDRDNPRSLGWVAQLLRGRLARLAEVRAAGEGGHAAPGAERGALSLMVPNTELWDLSVLCGSGPDGSKASPQLALLLQQCCDSAYNLSDAISAQYFTHSDARHSIAT
ncbi:A circularly permuted ATPgrasp family protein [Xylophilus rhododendri]|uniref:A circularly permuted ATPgrasp family protein n=1 Tax=Xylophilus rhododendri TaxID=2697032 RepID=A0A857J2J6_9BURK|nr:circularly permuted type 2 ATP-grasp protein [Xylophilus rhododendri]QHI97281.1 A circularly permuted ATPgrasp family protein [Xylophilus rhododendri]